jgi:hypothetical protein
MDRAGNGLLASLLSDYIYRVGLNGNRKIIQVFLY